MSVMAVDGEGGGTLGDGCSFFLFGGDSQLDIYQGWVAEQSVPPSEAFEFAHEVGVMEKFVDVEGFRETVVSLKRHFGIEEYHQAPGGLNLVEAQSWAQGVRWKEFDRDVVLEGLPEDVASWSDLEHSGHVWFSVAKVRRLIYALWSLMAQPIAAPRSERAGRQYRRRWERDVGTMPNYGDVRVVTLRRTMGDGGGETDDVFGREWTHRWVVRGHWRNQWYPSEGVHRMVWIAPFVKGPEDKPLIVKDTVFSVVR
jgi:hypothetical protein